MKLYFISERQSFYKIKPKFEFSAHSLEIISKDCTIKILSR